MKVKCHLHTILRRSSNELEVLRHSSSRSIVRDPYFQKHAGGNADKTDPIGKNITAARWQKDYHCGASRGTA
jgi:hypothetical protein